MKLVRTILKYASGTLTRTTEETNALRIFERNTARKICGPVKEKERWRIRAKKEGHITGGRYCKIYKIPLMQIIWSW
jgi:hypothetical protein